MKFSQLFLWSICVTAAFVHAQNEANTTNQPPNVIIYIADDQNYWDYETFGNPQVVTSAVNRLVKEGMTFSNAYTAQAICSPSRSQIYTGLYPIKNGCMANHLPVKDVPDINDYLGDLGYEVVLAGKGHIKPNRVFNWTHHFQTEKYRGLPIKQAEKYMQQTKKPFCVVFASDFPHGPYPKDSKYETKPLDYDPSRKPSNKRIARSKAGYYQNIEKDNNQLERVFHMMDRLSLDDNTIFIYLSDHGIKGKWGVKETGLKIPMVVRWPRVVNPGSVSNQMVSVIDILPTIIDIAHGSKQPMDGASFLPILEGNEVGIHDHVFGVATRQNIQQCYIFPSRSVRNTRYKYIKNFNSIEVVDNNLGDNPNINKFIRKGAEAFKHVPYEELYDLENDPFEHNNLAKDAAYAQVKSELASTLEHWMNEQGDFLLAHKMPLIKPTLHPLDRNSKWNKVASDMLGTIDETDYMTVHYE